MPVRNTTIGGITASSPHFARNATLRATIDAASTSTNGGTSSAW
jgi:hypothetical protein